MLKDDLFHRLASRDKRSRHDGHEDSFMNLNGRKRGNIINNLVSESDPDFDPFLELIMTYADLDASVDSSARFPPPMCHPATRVKIENRLHTWLTNPDRTSNLAWLYGPAGTGKSAVVKTFAEGCAAIGHLGASFFFSRPNLHYDPNTVIPTLIYQLAVCNPHYKSLVATQLVDDPGLLLKIRRVQFQKLIIEPFSYLQAQKRNQIREPLLVVLDGLDFCEDEDVQREFVEMIGEVVRLKKYFPLVWLICSRLESHLKYLFSRADFTVMCGREELEVDAELRGNVDFYIRDALAGIKADFPDVTTPEWPPKTQIAELSRKVFGRFGFANNCLQYIGRNDQDQSTPMSRLDAVLSGAAHIVDPGPTNSPLKTLDALYTQILSNVPKDILPTTMQILGFRIFLSLGGLDTAQDHCNFLHIDQATFYKASRNLHSVIDIPPPESASKRHLLFYHESFKDYLRDPSRSGEFAIEQNGVNLISAKLYLSWYKTNLELFHPTDDPIFHESHDRGISAGLSWVSDDNSGEISRRIASSAEIYCWYALQMVEEWDGALLSQIQNFDFRYIRTDNLNVGWRLFVNKLWAIDSSSGLIRIEPHTEVDLRLLENMKSMVGPLWHSKPAAFPLDEKPNQGEYFFLGHGLKAVICWANCRGDLWCNMLSADQPPSKEGIDAYQAEVQNSEGDDRNDFDGGSRSESGTE